MYYPPKPALTLTVGVTGHRSTRLKSEHCARIAQQLSDVFQNIDLECREELHRNGALLYKGNSPHVNLISSLADGTDVMAVQQCPPTWTTVGLLPSPADIYGAMLEKTAAPDRAKEVADEFKEAQSAVTEIMALPKGPDGDDGLARVCGLMLRHIDVLVAVWDKRPAEVVGGTASVVEKALVAGIPVIWIAANDEQRPWVIEHLNDVARDTPMADATSGPIAEMVRRVLSVEQRPVVRHGAWEGHQTGVSPEERLEKFLGERVPAAHRWVAYDWMKSFPRLWLWRATKRLANTGEVSREWRSFLAALPESGGFRARLETVLWPRYAAADALATYYSHKYRSAYVLAYLLSVGAVASALASFVFVGEVHHTVPLLEIGLAGLEFMFVTLIVAIVSLGQAGRWHDRWLDYRALAEMLRQLRFLGLLGQYEKRASLEASARPSAGWVLWYLRATMRELGMPAGYLGPEYQRKVLRAFVPAELSEQIDYHSKNMVGLRRLHRGLHISGNICFALAFVILFLFLFASAISYWIPAVGERLVQVAKYITALTALLPTLGAAFAGIRFTGDFEGFAERSAQTGSELDALKDHCTFALDRLDFDTTADVLFESAHVMAADINGWTTLYSRKHLTLPG
jgi:hypothetical protein